MKSTVAIYGGNFDPPGLHHTLVAEEIAKHFDELIIVPSGPRPDKPVSRISPGDRSLIVTMAFSGIRNATIDYADLANDTFTRTYDLRNRYAGRGDCWFVVGSDWIQGGRRKQSAIHGCYRGEEVWYNFRFAVVMRSGYPVAAQDLPPISRIFAAINWDISSTRIRSLLASGRPIGGMVAPDIERFIRKKSLYRKRS